MTYSQSSLSIRKAFIDFFVGYDHTFVPSSPVIPHDDPTLYFTNAGMNQFKSIFLGENPRGLKRAVNAQKCMRVSGKHNDLEEVGRDHYHHTFFEMLGNWSFGDYYKREAIAWSWELLTKQWRLPKERLYATVYEEDAEAEEIWKTVTDLRPGHVGRFGAMSNFWEMGETGPCGPCSEIHIDLGVDACPNADKPEHCCGVNADECSRYLELWNLVFIQYNRNPDGTLTELPAKHIDTGMGLERIVRILQGVPSNYDTDLFAPLIRRLEQLCGRPYDRGERGTPFRVIADHVRSLTFAITDGIVPSNDGRGYVLRRLLRRAYRFGRELGFNRPFLGELVPTVVEIMGEAYPEIEQRQVYVAEVISGEEERFAQTLEQGITRFEEMVQRCCADRARQLSGDDVFVLYDTYGFPPDLTRIMAAERGLSIDENGYAARMEQQRLRARDGGRGSRQGLTADGWVELASGSATEFVGYTNTEATGRVWRYKIISAAGEALLSVDRTPFYAESGGQVGDRGVMVTATGKSLEIVDTFKWNDSVIHRAVFSAEITHGDFAEPLILRVDSCRRAATQRNHSATHLLQAALRRVVGANVQQAGSQVGPEGLRFDFTHFRALSDAEKARVEEMVNEWILQNVPVSTAIMTLDEARRQGAVALFGEKYGEMVRVVSVGTVSKELCGGTHVSFSGEIGLFCIITENSIAAGVRRIEAVTGLESLAFIRRYREIVDKVGEALHVGIEKIPDRIVALQARLEELELERTRGRASQACRDAAMLLDEAIKREGPLRWIVKNLGGVDKQYFSAVADAVSDYIRERNLDEVVAVVGAEVDGKALFAASAGSVAVKRYGLHCGELVKAAAAVAGGGGGGSAHRAQAGGKNALYLRPALAAAEELIKRKLTQ